MFTVATAITRLTSGPTNIFGDRNLTSGQQLQRINEILEYFYDQGTWRGVQSLQTLTTSSGILTLASAYQRLDGLAVPVYGRKVPIKSMSWAFSANATPVQDWTLYSDLLAIDMGDNASGLRQYQLTGGITQLDALSFSGLCRKRFSYITDTATVVSPDCYDGLVNGVLAFQAKDQKDWDNFAKLGKLALDTLNGNLGEFEGDERQVQVEVPFGMGSFHMIN